MRGMTAARFAIKGMVIGVLVAAAVGLVLGLIANPPTAWFAVVELGVPGAFVGAVIGLTAGLILTAIRRAKTLEAGRVCGLLSKVRTDVVTRRHHMW
jgi:hypothetical protein